MPLTWANHPNPLLREKLAAYIGAGYRIATLSVDSAEVVRRRRSTRAAWLFINPFYLFEYGRKREDRIRISVDVDGMIRETTL